MATIRKRASGRWHVQIRLKGHDPVTRTFDTHAEAVTWARTTEAELDATREDTGGATVGGAILRYGRTIETAKADSTRRGERAIFRWWYKRLGGMLLVDLRPEHIALARDDLRATRSPATVNRYLAAISSVLQYASRDWSMIRSNPARRVRRLRESQGRIRYLSRDELDALLPACEAQRHDLYVAALVALTTGMRQGEIMGLRWRDVDFERRTIVLHKTKNRSRRGLPMSDQLADALETLRDNGSPYVFPMDSDPSRSSWWTLRRSWEKAVDKAGLEDFRFHDLRHTAASYLAMSGATEREIAELLGHKTPQTTRRYTHLSPGHLSTVADKLSHAILPTGNQSPPQPDSEDDTE